MSKPEYNPLASSEVEDDQLQGEQSLDTQQNAGETNDAESGERVRIVILDSAQHRFFVDVDPDWSVKRLKSEGTKTHKIAPSSQRLIFRGKMLDDSKVLRDVGVDRDNVILHLFPKPKIVVTSSDTTDNLDTFDDEGSGAHVPQIVLDEDEQQRRGQILVLGSAEIAESQNNVKLSSLLLLVMSAMRLLTLFSVATGAAAETQSMYTTDDIVPVPLNPDNPDSYPDSNHTGYDDDAFNNTVQIRDWENRDYFDLVVSAIGFAVALLGMKATTENTSRLATVYLIGTVIEGIGWNIWNILWYFKYVKDNASQSKEEDVAGYDDLVTTAFFIIMLPCFAWCLCCVRAWEFRRLIEEAEVEAAERVQSQLTISDEEVDQDGDETEREQVPIV